MSTIRGRPRKHSARVGLVEHILAGGSVKAWALDHNVAHNSVGKWLREAGVYTRWVSAAEWEVIKQLRKKAA